ncbi:MAG: DoxX family protein [Planctomycetes bacterium]|nr:DoxX family protein [Planctomycetota bacterium]
MNRMVLVERVLLGVPLVVFGAAGLFTVLPDPHAAWEGNDAFAPAAKDLLLALWDSGFLMTSVCVVHLLAGLLLLGNRFVPLALAMHLPVSVEMTLFHLTLDPGTGAMAYAVLLLNLVLIVAYRGAYAGLRTARWAPDPVADLPDLAS